jgi:GNAT superfamily N-acetyltransferase
MLRIFEPTTEVELDLVRALMRAFVGWARMRYAAELEFVDCYFDEAAFETELVGLPGKYGRPKGRLLLALEGERPAGCVAFRELGAGVCEMKRLYVDPSWHGKGVGRALVAKVIQEAKLAGYSTMRLDTGPNQVEAQTLYRSTGFKLIPAYYDLPDKLRNWLVFMELKLS